MRRWRKRKMKRRKMKRRRRKMKRRRRRGSCGEQRPLVLLKGRIT